jgi:ferredoxin
MKIEIDKTKCETAGECVKICPEIFQFSSGDKKAKSKVDEIPEACMVKCLQAAEACPTNAIKLK